MGYEQALGAMGNTAQAAGQDIGQLYGTEAQEKGFDQSNKVLQALLQQINAIGTPNFQNLTSQNVADAYGSNPEDPQDRASQLKVLDALMNIYNQGGMDPQAKAAYAGAVNAANQQQTGQAGAMQQQLQARGLDNSGLALAGQMGAAQNEGQMLGSMGTQIAGNAASRRDAALMGAGGMANQMRGQDWAEINAKAQAQNALNEWNSEFARQAQMMNNQYQQQGFQDAMQKVGAQGDVMTKQADQYSQQGDKRYTRDTNQGNMVGQQANNLMSGGGSWGSFFGGG